MTHIAIILPESLPMPPVKGGAVENLVQHIIDYNEKVLDIKISVFSIWAPEVDSYNTDNLSCTTYQYYKPSGVKKYIDLLYKIIRIIKRQAFHNLSPSLYEVEAYKMVKRAGIQKVVLANCPYSAPYINRKNEFHVIQYLHNDYLNERNVFTERVFESSQQYIAVSNFIKKRLQVVIGLSERVDVCYNGIELERFGVSDEKKGLELRNKFKIKETDKVVLFIGRIAENKGVLELIQAFLKIANKHKDWKLFIVGSHSFSDNNIDEYGQRLRALAACLDGQVVFTGYVDYKDIPSYHQIASICAVPSTCYESFNLTSVEAQASGHPVIVSDAGGIIETVTDKSGIIVKRDAHFVENLAIEMEKVLSDESLYEEMKIAAKESAKRFPAEEMCKSFVKLVK